MMRIISDLDLVRCIHAAFCILHYISTTSKGIGLEKFFPSWFRVKGARVRFALIVERIKRLHLSNVRRVHKSVIPRVCFAVKLASKKLGLRTSFFI